MINRILVVCVGNICRSPMAAAMLDLALNTSSQDGTEIEIRSAGIGALVGHPADLMAQKLMLKQGIDISDHRACQLDRNLLYWADLILVMEKEHKKSVFSLDISSRGKVYRLGEWSDFDVPDPYRQSYEKFEIALGCIIKGIDDWVPKLKGGLKE